jgi:putative addiction module component (TIGR02574 family)
MPILDFSRLTIEERLDLIGEIWESIDHDAVPLTEAQAAEIDRRVALLDAAPVDGRDAFEALADFRRRHG